MPVSGSAVTGSRADGNGLPFIGRDRSGRKCLKHIDAETIEDALTILSDHMGEAKIVAGGTELIRLLETDIVSPLVLINIKTIPKLAAITQDAAGLRIGSLATLHEIESSPIIRDEYPMLAEAAHLAASPQIRNMATLGGNLCQDVNCWYYRRPMGTGSTFTCRRKGGTVCYAPEGDNRYHAIMGKNGCFAVFTSDLAPALVAFDAKMKITGPTGETEINVEDFYTPWGNVLKPNEIVTEIQVPTLQPGTKQRYLKFRMRNAIDPALSSVAAVIHIEEGVVKDARIAVGGIAPMPFRALGAENVIKGKVITDALSDMAGKVAMSEAVPLSMNAYKVRITEMLIKRAIGQ